MKRWFKRRWLMLLILFVILLLAFFYFSRPPVFQYHTITVKRQDLQRSVLAMGSLNAVRKVDVGAQVSGQLEKIYVQVGDQVKKGQLLAQIDPTPEQNQVEIAQASISELESQIDQAKAQYHLAIVTFDRKKKLGEVKALAAQELDSAQADVQIKKATIAGLDAQLIRLKAQLNTAKTNLGYTRIVAPMSGTVVNITTLEGQTVIAAQQAPTILTLADLSMMEVNAEISEADITKVHPGQKVWFSVLGEPDKRYYSTIKDIRPTPHLINNAIFYYAQLEVPNPDGQLRLQMTAQVHILLSDQQNVLTVPLEALGNSLNDNKYSVKVLSNGQPENKIVTIGERNNTDAQVLSGLNEGDAVIVGIQNQSGAGNMGDQLDDKGTN